MTDRECHCPHFLPGHYLWTGCATPGCDCTYRWWPTSTPEARAAAKEAAARAVTAAKERRIIHNNTTEEQM